jgi:hypothetical protein
MLIGSRGVTIRVPCHEWAAAYPASQLSNNLPCLSVRAEGNVSCWRLRTVGHPQHGCPDAKASRPKSLFARLTPASNCKMRRAGFRPELSDTKRATISDNSSSTKSMGSGNGRESQRCCGSRHEPCRRTGDSRTRYGGRSSTASRRRQHSGRCERPGLCTPNP